MKAAVQSPARETTMRAPAPPGRAATMANWCQPTSAWRLMPRVVPISGVGSPSRVTSAAWADGRSTAIRTRRSRSHGQTTPAVAAASSQTAGEVTKAWSSRCSSAVLIHTSTIAAQPQKRWVTSKPSCRRARAGGAARATMTSRRTATNPAATRAGTGAVPFMSSTATKATYHAVPASAAPTCRPPWW